MELAGLSKFGDLLTADHAIFGDPDEMSRRGGPGRAHRSGCGHEVDRLLPSANKSMEDSMNRLADNCRASRRCQALVFRQLW